MNTKDSLIDTVKENILHRYPAVIDIDVSLERKPNRRYQSKIILRTKNKSYFSEKTDQNYKQSLDKSSYAIKKQLEKVKISEIHRNHPKIVFTEEVPEVKVA
jgi:ribosome-associated translation inhibitor RaiA